ncbi:MAG TPA: response regulator [Kofleriaceae bacterium]|nr:response regulator [Kofleriaceae bacterium]
MAPEGDDFAPEELALLRSYFRDEANETLEQVTRHLLGAGGLRPGDEALTELMRATHTLKGSAGTVGLTAIVEFAHALEDRLAQLRGGRITWTSQVVDAFVDAVDALRSLCDDVEESSAQELLIERVRQKLARLVDIGTAADDGQALPVAPMPEPEVTPTPAPGPQPPLPGPDDDDEELDLDRPPTSDGTPQPIGGDTTHTVSALPPGAELSGPVAGRVLRVDASRIEGLMDSAGELVFDRTRIERRVQHVRGLARELGRLRQRARDQLAALRTAAGDADRAAVVDGFRALEGELAATVTQISRITGGLLEDTEALRRTTGELQEGLTRMRMQAVGALFQRLAPPLRAIARAANRRVRLQISGGDTEFDRTVAEQIVDPLIQLLRNAVAHGIEPAEVRSARGKPPEGTISLAARQSGGLVIIEVADDGAGIDPAALRERLVASGRWTRAQAEVARDDEVLLAIFEPGVTTRDAADQLAGRGVGLDAVRATITRLGGEVRLHSTPGKGSIFTMRLPVSTAVSHATLFKVRGQVYAIPNVHVIGETRLATALGQVAAGADDLPVVSLHAALGADIPFDVDDVAGLTIEFLGRRFAITCDKVIGPRQIIVKDMGPLLAPLSMFAGATISGSGKVQLILDAAALLQLAYPGNEAAPATPAAPAAETEILGRVLVVDDSPAIREAMSRILSRSGYIVDVADDGARAWDMARELRYDAVLTDLEMPRLDGFGLIEKLRAHPPTESVPVVIISSRTSAANRKRARELGVDSFLAKPITRRKLTDLMTKLRG